MPMARLRPRAGLALFLCAAIRDFTRMSGARAPYDKVFVFNRMFAVPGVAIERRAHRKHVGDGFLALFEGPQGARNALLAAREIGIAPDPLNRDLAAGLTRGVHVGPPDVVLTLRACWSQAPGRSRGRPDRAGGRPSS